jgi:hypothetical protein
VTANRVAPAPTLDGLPATLADIVCWLVFYLQRSTDDEIDETVAEELQEVIAGSLRLLPVWDRIEFLEHAARRAATSQIPDYQDFLLDLAESLGIE